MNDTVLAWVIGLSVTAAPVGFAAWWGEHRARLAARARALDVLLERMVPGLERMAASLRRVGVSSQQAGANITRYTAALREADRDA